MKEQKNFKLLKKLRIKNPKLNINPQNNCFLYHFKRAGITKKQLTKWLDGKILDVYEFTGRFGGTKKCPWCGEEIENNDHFLKHKKSTEDVHTIKLTNQAYKILLEYTRTGDYDTLMFLVNRNCQYCIVPGSKDREGKCELPESARNKPKSLRTMGFKCNGFETKDYSDLCVAFIYRNKPTRSS